MQDSNVSAPSDKLQPPSPLSVPHTHTHRQLSEGLIRREEVFDIALDVAFHISFKANLMDTSLTGRANQ